MPQLASLEKQLEIRHCERSAAIRLSVRHCERSAAICLSVRHCERSAAICLSVRHCERSAARLPGKLSLRAQRGNLAVSSSLRAKRGNLLVSLSLRAKRGNLPLVFLFFFARYAATQRYPKGTMSACWFVILSAAKDLILRKQADCRAPARHIKAGVIPAAGARSDGLAAACVPWAKLASAARLSVISSLRAKRGNLPVSSSLRAKRGDLSMGIVLRC